MLEQPSIKRAAAQRAQPRSMEKESAALPAGDR
jgi:hypothetical protein